MHQYIVHKKVLLYLWTGRSYALISCFCIVIYSCLSTTYAHNLPKDIAEVLWKKYPAQFISMQGIFYYKNGSKKLLPSFARLLVLLIVHRYQNLERWSKLIACFFSWSSPSEPSLLLYVMICSLFVKVQFRFSCLDSVIAALAYGLVWFPQPRQGNIYALTSSL